MSNHVENMTQAKRESASSGAENIQMQINLNENHSVDCEMMDSTNSPPAQQASSNLVGWRLHGTTLGTMLCLFLANLEVSIVSTSLVSITDDLQGFSRTSWIVSGYLLTYTAFIIIWAKLSDIVGRKPAILATVFSFVAFSAGCGASQTINELIIFRTFQGIGAAGTYSISVLLIYEMVPKSKYHVYGSLASITVACATLSGPLFGGLISDRSSWRWIFFLNLPAGTFAIALMFLALPSGFPFQARSSSTFSKSAIKAFPKAWQRLDIIGAGLLLAASLLLVTALLETSFQFSWSSRITILLLVFSACSWILFIAWEWLISSDIRKQEPIFPWHFLFNRAWMGMLLTSFFVGVPFNIVVITLPQRFQAIDGVTPLVAGVRLIPYIFTASIGSLVANIVAVKAKIPPIHLLFFGTALQVLGLVLLSTLPVAEKFPTEGYGYEVLAGIGVGVTFGILILTTPFVADAKDLAVATGSIIQFRFLGGAIGLAIATSVMNSYLEDHLTSILSGSQLQSLLRSADKIATFDLEVQRSVRHVFLKGYNIQFKIMAGLAAVQFLSVALMWKNGRQIKVA